MDRFPGIVPFTLAIAFAFLTHGVTQIGFARLGYRRTMEKETCCFGGGFSKKTEHRPEFGTWR
jgi:hypothetical protein